MPKLETQILHRVAGSLNLAFGLLLSGLLILSVYGLWLSPVPLLVAALGFCELRYGPALSSRRPALSAALSVLSALVAAPLVCVLVFASVAGPSDAAWLIVLRGVVFLAAVVWIGAQSLKFVLWLGGLIESSMA